MAEGVVRESIEAFLTGKSEEQRGGQDVVVYLFKVKPEDQYPVKVTWWQAKDGPPEAPPPLRVGQRYRVAFDKKAIPPREGERASKGFWRNWVNYVALDGSEGPLSPLPPAAPTAKNGARTPAKAAPAPPEGRSAMEIAEKARQRSIMAQVALKAATEYAVAKIHMKADDMHTSHLLNAASLMLRWLQDRSDLVPDADDGGVAAKGPLPFGDEDGPLPRAADEPEPLFN